MDSCIDPCMVTGMSARSDVSPTPLPTVSAARATHANQSSALAELLPGNRSSGRLRFLCDRMLIRLCRWLRAAGYNASQAGERTSDCKLLAAAIAEQRYLLTRDRKLLEHRDAAGCVIRLLAASPGDQAAELVQHLPVDWLYQPFTRCLLCNEALIFDPGLGAPPASHGPFRRCPSCTRLYWEGAHVQRMRAQLATWRYRTRSGMHGGGESSIL